MKLAEIRRIAARRALWQIHIDNVGGIAHVFYPWSDTHLATLCGRRFPKNNLVLIDVFNSGSHCKMCEQTARKHRDYVIIADPKDLSAVHTGSQWNLVLHLLCALHKKYHEGSMVHWHSAVDELMKAYDDWLN